MQNEYRYIDPDHTYTDPLTGVLRNLAGIEDAEELLFFESAAVTKRLVELRMKPLTIEDSSGIFVIHKYLFQDVYAWAGIPRTVEISKGGSPFFPTRFFGNALRHIDELIRDFGVIHQSDKETVATQLAKILDTVNHLHPFREGNGRTQRELIRQLALSKGYTLNLNPPDNGAIYQRYMNGTILGNTKELACLISENLLSKTK